MKCVIKSTLSHMHVGPGHCLEIIPPYSRSFYYKSSHPILLQILYLYFLLAASILLAPPAGLDIIPLYVLDPLFTNHPTLFYCKSFICIFCWLFPSFLQLLLVQKLSHPTLEPLFTNHPTLFQILYICIFCWQLPSCWHLLLATITPAESAIINSFLLMCFLFSASKQHHRLGSCHLRIIDVKIYQHF